MAAGTAAVTAFAKASIDAGSQFDSTMSQVAAISGATGEDFDALREKAMEMGASTKFSATESAEAFTYMAMAGWKTGDMLDGIEGIMNLAAAAGENLATTSDIVTDALTAFGLSAEDSGRFADVLAAASSNANTNVSMLGESFKYVAPVAGSLGYSAEDTAVALGLMANSGIKASQAGTALRTLLTNMAKPTDDMAYAMNRLGVSLADDEGNMYSFMEIMEQLRTGFNESGIGGEEFQSRMQNIEEALDSGRLTTGEYEEAIRTLFEDMDELNGAEMAEYAAMLAGKEGMSGLLAIVNASDEDFQKLTDSIYGADGAAKQMAATMVDNLAGDVTLFKSALEGAQIVLSDQLTPNLREFVQFGSTGISQIADAFQEGGLSGAMGAFGTVLSDGLNMVIEMSPQMVDAGMQLIGALGQGLIDNLPVITDAAVQIVIMLATSLISALPDIAASAIEIITTLSEGISGALPELVPVAVDAILQLVETLTNPDSLDNIINAAITLITSLADGIINALPTLIEKAPVIIENLVTALANNLPKILQAGLELIVKLAAGVIQNIPKLVGAIPTVIGAFVSGFVKNFGSILSVGKDLVNKVGEGVKNLASSAVTWGKDLIDNFVSGIKNAIGKVKDAVSNVASTVKSFLGFSEPEEGPLSNFHTYAPDMMKLFAQGIAENAGIVQKQLDKSLNFDFGTANVDFASSGLSYSGNGGPASGATGGSASPITIIVQSVLDGKVIGETAYTYAQNRQRAYGGA